MDQIEAVSSGQHYQQQLASQLQSNGTSGFTKVKHRLVLQNISIKKKDKSNQPFENLFLQSVMLFAVRYCSILKKMNGGNVWMHCFQSQGI